RLLRLELVGDHPTRRFAGKTESLTLLEIIDLDHHSVRFVRQVVPFVGPCITVFYDCLNVIERRHIRIDGESETPQQIERSEVGPYIHSRDCGQRISEETQVPPGSLSRVE